jgi:hypothetical protein
MSGRVRVAFLTTVVLLLLAACTPSTTLTTTWKAPDAATVSPVGKTIVAVFISKDEGIRRPSEDTMARELTARGANAIPGYTILPTPPTAQSLNGDEARAKLAQAGANAVVVMRIIGQDQRITYTPGSFTGPRAGFGPYWGYGWGAVYTPGSIRTDTDVSVETLVYSLRPNTPDKLLWASTSRTTNPNNVTSLINEVAAATAREMTNQGFLAAAAAK